jgi:hypothetical protein
MSMSPNDKNILLKIIKKKQLFDFSFLNGKN